MKTGEQKMGKTARLNKSEPELIKFPIVCIGASAGGLEALEQFISHIPAGTGIAFVVIQHLDPTQKGMLPELLQRKTNMQVIQVKDRMMVKPNQIYVIPPNKSMSISKRMLHLVDPAEIRGLRLPIDFFMRSLAIDQRENAIGVILSGMGSDGSFGLKAIKEQNGIVIAQDPADAKFDSMPRNAINSIQIDIVATAGELPVLLLNYINQVPPIQTLPESNFQDKNSLEKIIIIIRDQTGNDFSMYKKNTMYRRIERRMGVHQINKISIYVNFLKENPKEVEILFKELMIGVTNFFREPEVWKKLKDDVLPNLIVSKGKGAVIRAWIAGCSTGEEAYSLAIVFKETLEKINPNSGIILHILATDLDNEAIETARKGIFSTNITADVSHERLNRFFTFQDDQYRIKTEIREMIVFAQHNIIMHPPFTSLNILSCRNLLIYLDAELQRKMLGLFYYSLIPEGILLLGSSESLGSQSQLFKSISDKLKIYKRNAAPSIIPELYNFQSTYSHTKPVQMDSKKQTKSIPNLEELTDKILLQNFSPPGVLVNENGDILYISGRTGKYLEPAVGKANMNIYAMLRDGLRTEFPVAFRKAILNNNTVIMQNLAVGTNGGTQNLNVTIKWIDKPDAIKGFILIIFNDLPKTHLTEQPIKKKKGNPLNTKQVELEEELQHTREEMQKSPEEMQTSQEELKSTNEELQSTNEELQSTNEELTSSKEEMQSLNEELQTVNVELQSKIEEYSRVNNDMNNLLSSTEIATLFLDKELNIRKYTPQATKIFKLIKSDIGRPLTDLVSDLVYPELTTDASEVLKTLVYIKKQITTRDLRWFSVRIMPYRTLDDKIDGLVITLFNITDLKKLEEKMNEKENFRQIILNCSTNKIIRLSSDFKILEINPEAEKALEISHKEAFNQNFIHLFIPEQNQKKTEKELNKLMKENLDFKIKLEMLKLNQNTFELEWSFNLLKNHPETGTELIMIA